jgi:hypothetical protein
LAIRYFEPLLYVTNDGFNADCSAALFSNADVCQALSVRAPDARGKIGDLKLPGFEE